MDHRSGPPSDIITPVGGLLAFPPSMLRFWGRCKTFLDEIFRLGRHMFDAFVDYATSIAKLVVKVVAAVVALRLAWSIYQWVLRDQTTRRQRELGQWERNRQERLSLVNGDPIGGGRQPQTGDNQCLQYYPQRNQVYESIPSTIIRTLPLPQCDLQSYIQQAIEKRNSAHTRPNIWRCWQNIIDGLRRARLTPPADRFGYLYVTDLEAYAQLPHTIVIGLLISKAKEVGLATIAESYFWPLLYTPMYSILTVERESLTH